ncbi:hypothetical protein DFP72DRAFT_845611 [Ephemerocybe angulata]|uniref:Uncharacterized protein n=1 Tax=Ephemerocybe angulata TaxID=980116 RepID=A0A8H6I4B2_9AGAR|nr:hypothetical protein DFP72DRAFT_845611 [Tulosesus angulatus]
MALFPPHQDRASGMTRGRIYMSEARTHRATLLHPGAWVMVNSIASRLDSVCSWPASLLRTGKVNSGTGDLLNDGNTDTIVGRRKAHLSASSPRCPCDRRFRGLIIDNPTGHLPSASTPTPDHRPADLDGHASVLTTGQVAQHGTKTTGTPWLSESSQRHGHLALSESQGLMFTGTGRLSIIDIDCPSKCDEGLPIWGSTQLRRQLFFILTSVLGRFDSGKTTFIKTVQKAAAATSGPHAAEETPTLGIAQYDALFRMGDP